MEKSPFICPVCNSPLEKKEKSLLCKNNHLFDESKNGYVNLLMSQEPKNKNHGDDKLMVRSRRDFLEKGYYGFLLHNLCNVVKKYAKQNYVILDAGCGECYYTLGIANALESQKINTTICAVDISKAALSIGGKKDKRLNLAIASVYKLPIKDESIDILVNVFSPYCGKEYLRVLKKGGIMTMVIPLENHLFSLKKAIYDKPYKNQVKDFSLEGFDFLEEIKVVDQITLENSVDIKNLFTMTPYYYKTGEKDQNKLNSLNLLTTQAEFGILIYKKQ